MSQTSTRPSMDFLSEVDGNAFAILGAYSREARRAGVPASEIQSVIAEAQSGDYDHLLQTIMNACD